MLKRCRECGRPLKSRESQARGFGLTCAAKFADRYVAQHPDYLTPRARKLWTRREIKQLAKFVGGLQ